MSLLKRVFDFYLDASIHVALSVFSLVWLTGLILDIPIDRNLALFLFFGTIASYNFIKYGLEAEKYILVANRYHKNIQFLSFGVLAFAGYISFFFKWNTWIGLGTLAFLTGVYALPVLPKAKNFRNLGGFKVLPVALVWAGSTVILPLLEIGEQLVWDIWVETAQRFLAILILILPFEIRDLQFDALEHRTIPQRFGIKGTKVMGVVLTVLFFVSTFLKDAISQFDLIIKTVMAMSLIVVLMLSKERKSKYYASFWVEALPIFWWAIGYFIFEGLDLKG